jgi:antitoxin component YwqK of YwqJK toxin-antitoxin module
MPVRHLLLIVLTSCTATLPKSGIDCPSESEVKTSNDGERGSREWCEDANESQHGTWIHYYPNGRKSEQATVKHGKIHGTKYEWYESGKTKMVTEWRDYHRVGIETRWHENGVVAWRGNFIANKRDGIWTAWYPNKKAAWSGKYVMDEPTGTWVFWNEDGTQAHVEDFSTANPRRRLDNHHVLRGVEIYNGTQLVSSWTISPNAP